MWTVKKVLNSSVVLATDGAGVDAVLLGKGIGYDRKQGQHVDRATVDQVFVARDHEGGLLAELLQEVPSWYLALAHDIVRVAERRLQRTLDRHVYRSLTDHLHFAVERAREGMPVLNRLAWEMRSFYPAEYAVAEDALERLRARVDVDLPDDEAANIAFHLVNAARGDAGFNALQAVKLIDTVTTIVRYTIPEAETTGLHWARFLTHLQFFAERFASGKLLTSRTDFLFRQMTDGYPRAMATAERVRDHLATVDEVTLPNEEVAYLALHIQRLTDDSDVDSQR